MIRRLSLAGVAALFAALTPAPAGAGGTCHVAPDPFDARTRTIPMEKLCFAPVVARVPRGATVTWINRDPAPHTVTGVGEAWGSYDEILDGKRVSYSFDDEGVFPYYCIIHPGMTGAVVVGDGIGNGALAPAVVATSTGTNSQAQERGPAEPAAATSSTWPWVGAVVVGGAMLALVVSQRRRLRVAEKPSA